MKELIFVGGAQYQGKTSFCNDVEKIAKKQVMYFPLDEIGKKFYDDKSRIFDFLKKYGVSEMFASLESSSNDLFYKSSIFASAVSVGEQIKPFKKSLQFTLLMELC